ncbi:MAG: AsmA-like C-terminal region-containing protein [Flavobacteriaceae bacterium]
MKVIKKILGFIFLLIILIIAFTYFYKDTLVKRFVANYNENLNAIITYKDADLSLFKRFPHATITIDELTVVNKNIATSDTLLIAGSVNLAMNIEELFKKQNEKITLKNVSVNNVKLHLIIDENGKSNFDIHKLNTTSNSKNDNPSYQISINKYQITKTDIDFINKQTKDFISVKDLNHRGSVNFSTSLIDLITETEVSQVNSAYQGLSYKVSKPFMFDTNLTVNLDAKNISIQDLLAKNVNLNIEEIKTSKKITTKKTNTVKSPNFKFDLKKYAFSNANIQYKSLDNIKLNFANVEHSGNGEYANSTMDLTTKTFTKNASIKIGDIKYINNAKITLDAVLGIEFDKLKFILKKNKGKLNDLDLVFEGFIAINDKNQEMDIKFHSPKAKFKSILSLIPNAYSSSFNDVTATGITEVNGRINGFNSATELPKYNIHINTKDASFKYPNLPKAVKNITFNGAIVSTTSNNNVFLDIKKSIFTIDEDTFEMIGKITNLSKNPTVDAAFKGTLNLAKLSQAYPIKMDKQLTGILTANFTTKADQHAIETNQFSKIKTKGTAQLKDFIFDDEQIAKPIHIKIARINFKTNQVLLTKFKAKTGESDIDATGKVNNLFAFLFNDKNLEGNFKVNSNLFKVSDFLIDDNKTSGLSKNSTSENLKIPQFLDVTTYLSAKKVIYDNLVMENVTGTMTLKDQIATISNAQSKMLDGNTTFHGEINTKKEPTTFDLDLDIDKFDIATSFKTLETFQKLVPIAKAIKGKYNSTFKIKGFLNNEFIPNVNSVNGNAIAQLFVKEFNENEMVLLNELTKNLKFIDFKKIDLSKLKTILKFANGNVEVEPFDIKYKEFTMHVSGSHGFDKTLKYNLSMDVPAKHLGVDAVNLLSKLTNIHKDTIQIPLTTKIGGTLGKPNVQVGLKNALKILALKIIKYQKQELEESIKNNVNNTLDSLIKNNDLDSIIPVGGIDSIINGGVKDVLNDIMNVNKKGTEKGTEKEK